MLSNRPHNMAHYVLQGTRDNYESGRRVNDPDLIYLRSRYCENVPDSESHDFARKDASEHLDDVADGFVPDWYRTHAPVAMKAGHGVGDYFVMLDFLDAIGQRRRRPLGIHQAMNMTLPGLVSQQSIQATGVWRTVPDSRG